ncbi:hypothetical protein ACERIT_11810 [Halopenitus sp. H-Gu1]|uniref:hypothetical protein n=1 Tax=Halopenitus sp. H-Gu1 TaxID=3242697 RepID=UPI00359EB5AA
MSSVATGKSGIEGRGCLRAVERGASCRLFETTFADVECEVEGYTSGSRSTISDGAL